MHTLNHAADPRQSKVLLVAGLSWGLALIPATGAEKAKNEADYDLQAAAPMIEQMQRHLAAAAEAVQQGDGKTTREAFERADRVFALTRDFLRGADAAREEPRVPQTGRVPGGRLAPHRAPGLRRFWPDAFDDEEPADGFFGGRDPFLILREMQERMGRLLDESDWMRSVAPDDSGRARSPRMDMNEGKDAYIVRLDMPGLEKSEIDVKVEGLLLTITGRSESEGESRDDAGKTLRRERRSGRFQRTVTLPGPVQADKVDARYENGVLTITVPKAPGLPVDPRSIPIR